MSGTDEGRSKRLRSAALGRTMVVTCSALRAVSLCSFAACTTFVARADDRAVQTKLDSFTSYTLKASQSRAGSSPVNVVIRLARPVNLARRAALVAAGAMIR